MKKSIIAILMAALMVLFCACSSEVPTGDLLPVPETPAGWSTYVSGPVHIYYPTEGYEQLEAESVEFQIMESASGANINIVKTEASIIGVDLITETYIKAVIDSAADQLVNVYETSLGVECEATIKDIDLEKKYFGNKKCAGISYQIDIEIPSLDLSLPLSFYQVIHCGKDATYTVTYTSFPTDGVDAESYFAESIALLFVE